MLESAGDSVCAFLWEAVVGDDASGFGDADEARLGITGRWIGRARADPHVTQSKRGQQWRRAAVLVRDPLLADRVVELQHVDLDAQELVRPRGSRRGRGSDERRIETASSAARIVAL